MSIKYILSLNKYRFLKQNIDSTVLLTPISQQIKQNIANQWIKCNCRLPSVELFENPISETDPMTKSLINSIKKIIENYNNYYRVLSEGSNQLIGLIHKFNYLRDNCQTKDILSTNQTNELVFTMFCPKNQSLYWFQKIQSIHFHWFKNLTKSPISSQFFAETDKNNLKWTLNYKMEEMDKKVEEIHYICDPSSKQKLGLNDLDIISCHMNLDNSLLSFLCDGYTLKTYKNGNTVKKMKINSLLSPFKIAFTLRETNTTNDRIIEVIQYLIQSLKKFDIHVLPFTPRKLISIESCDELGIPYIAIIDESNIEKGLIAVRNRDSDTEEMIHISNFQRTMCLYLNVIHPSIICK